MRKEVGVRNCLKKKRGGKATDWNNGFEKAQHWGKGRRMPITKKERGSGNSLRKGRLENRPEKRWRGRPTLYAKRPGPGGEGQNFGHQVLQWWAEGPISGKKRSHYEPSILEMRI